VVEILERPQVLMRNTCLAVSIAAILSACDPPPPVPENTPMEVISEPTYSDAKLDPSSKAEPSNRYSRELFDMDGQMRRAMFRKLMRASGEQCDFVTEGVLRGGHKGTDMWRVACTDSGEWMVSIEPDSSTKILSCSNMKTLGDDCHQVWKK
jgi:hypothetical protein